MHLLFFESSVSARGTATAYRRVHAALSKTYSTLSKTKCRIWHMTKKKMSAKTVLLSVFYRALDKPLAGKV
jgi:hypothetical protein